MPLGEFRLVAVDEPVEAGKLQVPATLTEDGRIGKITDRQGLVSLRPLTSTRWTPVCGPTILRPGDWLRTDFQGANAVTVLLAPETKLILGPGVLVHLERPDRITLHSGVAELTPSPKRENFRGIVKLTGPAGTTLDVGGLLLVRADAKGLAKLAKDPPWLAGYKGNAAGSVHAAIEAVRSRLHPARGGSRQPGPADGSHRGRCGTRSAGQFFDDETASTVSVVEKLSSRRVPDSPPCVSWSRLSTSTSSAD